MIKDKGIYIRIDKKLQEEVRKNIDPNLSKVIRDVLEKETKRKRLETDDILFCAICEKIQNSFENVYLTIAQVFNESNEDDGNVRFIFCKDCFSEIINRDFNKWVNNRKKGKESTLKEATSVIIQLLIMADNKSGKVDEKKLNLTICLNENKPSLIELFFRLSKQYPLTYSIKDGRVFEKTKGHTKEELVNYLFSVMNEEERTSFCEILMRHDKLTEGYKYTDIQEGKIDYTTEGEEVEETEV